MATNAKAVRSTNVAKTEAPAQDLNAMIAAAVAQAMAAQAPKAKAAQAPKAKAAAPTADATAGLVLTVHQVGKSWASAAGNMMVAVRGTLPNGAKCGGNLWIKVGD